jgi:hypothetical protein
MHRIDAHLVPVELSAVSVSVRSGGQLADGAYLLPRERERAAEALECLLAHVVIRVIERTLVLTLLVADKREEFGCRRGVGPDTRRERERERVLRVQLHLRDAVSGQAGTK